MPQYWFFVSHCETRRCVDVVAESAETACSRFGWTATQCLVIPVGEIVARRWKTELVSAGGQEGSAREQRGSRR